MDAEHEERLATLVLQERKQRAEIQYGVRDLTAIVMGLQIQLTHTIRETKRDKFVQWTCKAVDNEISEFLLEINNMRQKMIKDFRSKEHEAEYWRGKSNELNHKFVILQQLVRDTIQKYDPSKQKLPYLRARSPTPEPWDLVTSTAAKQLLAEPPTETSSASSSLASSFSGSVDAHDGSQRNIGDFYGENVAAEAATPPADADTELAAKRQQSDKIMEHVVNETLNALVPVGGSTPNVARCVGPPDAWQHDPELHSRFESYGRVLVPVPASRAAHVQAAKTGLQDAMIRLVLPSDPRLEPLVQPSKPHGVPMLGTDTKEEPLSPFGSEFETEETVS
jgi:hypothetical protein